ncbi:MAG: hypothetical protein AB7O44_06620 [Hyphomicrobiaceae bacterium]
MHHFDLDTLTEQQRALAVTANAIVLQIHERLKTLTATNATHTATPAAIRAELQPFFDKLAIAEADLWERTANHVRTAEVNASAIAIILANPIPDAVAHIASRAAKVGRALNSMTPLQRKTMLLQPLVVLASNIAFDYEAEFGNEHALRRWTRLAAEIQSTNR